MVPVDFYGLQTSIFSISESSILGTEAPSSSDSEEELEVPDVDELLELLDVLLDFLDTDSESLLIDVDNERLDSFGDPTDCSLVIDTLDPDSVLRSIIS
jgi:hypothetical protein